MRNHTVISRSEYIARATLALFALVIILALLTVSYSAGLALTFGVVLPLLFMGAAQYFGRFRRLRSKRYVLASAVVVCVVMCALFLEFDLLISGPYLLRELGKCDRGPIVETYSAVMEASTPDADVFTLKETVTNLCPAARDRPNDQYEVTIVLPTRQLTATQRGLLLKEVKWVPLQAVGNLVHLSLPDGSHLTGNLCGGLCPQATVELRNMPLNSFFAVRDASSVKHTPYIDTETVTWSANGLDAGLAFAYVPAPYYYVRALVEPLVAFSSLDTIVLGMVGVFGTTLISRLVKPLLTATLDKTLHPQIAVTYVMPGAQQYNQSGGVNIHSGGDVTVSGDVVGRDKTEQSHE